MPDKFFEVLRGYRLERITMRALTAGAAAYGFGGSPGTAVNVTGVAALLAAGGYYLIAAGEAQKDRIAGRRYNPIAGRRLSRPAGLAIAALGFLGGLVLVSLFDAQLLLPLAGMVFVVSGRALRLFETPILRAVWLGTFNGLFVLLGGLADRPLSWGLLFTALYMFFEMTGIRVLSDLRDLSVDDFAGTPTIPRKYGIRWALVFLAITKAVALSLALAAYCTGILAPGFLYCTLLIAAAGCVIVLFVAQKPKPRTAVLAINLSFGLLGNLFLLALLLGRR